MQENAQKLLINHILFQLSHDQDPSSDINKLRENLPIYIEEPKLTQLPFDVLQKVVDFKIFEDDKESFQKVYTFCIKYLDEQEDVKNRSELFSTLNTSKISYEDLCRLTSNSKFDRTKLNDSLGLSLARIYERTDEIPKQLAEAHEKNKENLEEIKAIQERYQQDQNESQLLRKELKDQKGKIEQLTKQVSELHKLRLDDMAFFLKEIKDFGKIIAKEREEKERIEKEKRKKEEEERKQELGLRKAKVPLYYPDWSSHSGKSYSSYSAEEDGWMCVQTGCNSNSSIATVTVAGKKKFVISGCDSNYTYSSVFFPIQKKQSVKCSTSNLTSNSCYFIKSKKDKVVVLPDWTNAKLKVWFEEYTAECDGWVYADTGANSTKGYLKINNGLQMFICKQDSGYQSYSSVFVPVSSGDKYYFYHAKFPGVCYFIPGRKDYQIGMPDWDKEDSRSWETSYEANQKGWVYAQCQSY